MSSEQTISFATASADGGEAGPVSLPVDELMASNGLVTGQSGAAPAESVRHLAEPLLDAGETLFVVDPAGEFAALADHAAVLHVGGDDECDVRVDPETIDRVASLALDGDTSVVLDLATFDAGAADELLGRLTDELLDARRERRSDLLLVVDDCHRWLAASGPATRTGENIVQLGGRRHDGVGVVGVTDQPADVREDVRSGVDWVLAHRLTWQEDVRAVEGLVGRHRVDALESLGDDEAIFNAGWEGSARRVRVDGAPSPAATDTRSQTNSRSQSQSTDEDENDLFAGLPEARSPAAGTEDSADDGSSGGTESSEEVAALREELAAMENRVAALEAKLDAREDVEDVADRIASAITEGLQDAEFGPAPTPSEDTTGEPATNSAHTEGNAADSERVDDTSEADGSGDGLGGLGDVFGAFDDGDADATADAGPSDPPSSDSADSGTTSPATDSPVADGSTASADGGAVTDEGTSPSANGADAGGMSFEPVDFGFDDPSADVDSTVPDDFGPPARHGSSGRTIPRYLRKIVRSLEEMDATTRRMLGHYIDEGTESPMDAHYAAGGGGDRTRAYAHNRQLRTNGLIEHVGKGQYAPRLREYVVDEAGHSVPDHELDRAVDVIRQTVEAA